MKKLNSGTALIAALSLPLLPTASPGTAHAATDDGVCMSKVSNDTVAGRHLVLVPSDRASDMEAKGYVLQPCAGKEQTAADFPKKVCNFAEKAPEAIRERFRQAYNATADELCQLAKAAKYTPRKISEFDAWYEERTK